MDAEKNCDRKQETWIVFVVTTLYTSDPGLINELLRLEVAAKIKNLPDGKRNQAKDGKHRKIQDSTMC